MKLRLFADDHGHSLSYNLTPSRARGDRPEKRYPRGCRFPAALHEAPRLAGDGLRMAFIVGYGLYRGPGSDTVKSYLLAGRSMPWYAMGLSIMATQASAVTFISTTGKSYMDGMALRAFLLRIAAGDGRVLSATAVPPSSTEPTSIRPTSTWRSVSTRRPRALVSGIFLLQRGLAAWIFVICAVGESAVGNSGMAGPLDHGADGCADRG